MGHNTTFFHLALYCAKCYCPMTVLTWYCLHMSSELVHVVSKCFAAMMTQNV